MKNNAIFAIVCFLLILFFNLIVKSKKPAIVSTNCRLFGFNAIAVPPVAIFINQKNYNNSKLLKHELIHFDQYYRDYYVFYLSYLLQLILKGYDSIDYEIQARANESDFCKQNYTLCLKHNITDTFK